MSHRIFHRIFPARERFLSPSILKRDSDDDDSMDSFIVDDDASDNRKEKRRRLCSSSSGSSSGGDDESEESFSFSEDDDTDKDVICKDCEQVEFEKRVLPRCEHADAPNDGTGFDFDRIVGNIRYGVYSQLNFDGSFAPKQKIRDKVGIALPVDEQSAQYFRKKISGKPSGSFSASLAEKTELAAVSIDFEEPAVGMPHYKYNLMPLLLNITGAKVEFPDVDPSTGDYFETDRGKEKPYMTGFDIGKRLCFKDREKDKRCFCCYQRLRVTYGVRHIRSGIYFFVGSECLKNFNRYFEEYDKPTSDVLFPYNEHKAVGNRLVLL